MDMKDDGFLPSDVASRASNVLERDPNSAYKASTLSREENCVDGGKQLASVRINGELDGFGDGGIRCDGPTSNPALRL